jgi:hypothetical protein
MEHSGTADNDIDRAELSQHSGRHTFQSGKIRYVSGQGQSVAAFLANPFAGFFNFRPCPGYSNDRCASPSQLDGSSPANTSPGASYDSRLLG